MPRPKAVTSTVVLPREIHEAAKKEAKRQLISLAAWLRRAVQEALQKEESNVKRAG